MGNNNSSRLSAKERIIACFDEGTFVEIGAYVARRGDNMEKSEDLEGVITGWGSIGGRLVYAFAQDYSRTKGAMSEYHAKKIISLYRLAVENGAPIIGIFDSAGALIPEGVRALAGYGRIMNAVAEASGVIPQIALIPGVCAGASSVIASMFDFAIAVEGGAFSFTPAFTLGSADAASAESAAKDGLAAVSVSSDAEMAGALRELIAYLPMTNAEGTVVEMSSDDINRAADLSSYRASRKASDLVAAVADGGKYFELYKNYGDDMLAGFISLAGTVSAVVAGNGKKLSPAAARKTAKLVSFADAFNIPVITFVDCEGTETSLDAEKTPYSAELAKLAMAYAVAKTPVVTLISGEAYGTVFALLGSKSNGADIVFALDDAKVGAMSAKSAVAFLENNKIKGDVTREKLEEEYMKNAGSPAAAASSGEIDDIISDDEVRARIAAAVLMLSCKSKNQPAKRHISFPL